MKAVKFSVAAAAALALSTAALADGPVVYGKQNVEVGSFDSTPTVGGVETMGAKTQSSRFGIKGSHDLGDGLTGLYQIEIQHNLLGGVADIGSGARNSFVGFQGDFGTVVIGNHDHPSKLALYQSGGGVFAADTTAKLVQTELRSSPAAAYLTKMGDLTIGAAVVFNSEDTDNNTTNGNEADVMDFDVAVYGTAGDIKYGAGVILPGADGKEPVIQLSASMKMGAMTVGASLEQVTDSHMSILASVNMNMESGLYVGAGLQNTTWDVTGNDDNMDMSVIVGKKMGKFVDTYLAVKMAGDGTPAPKTTGGFDGTDVALGVTVAF